MSDWTDGYRHVERWLTLAARLEGLIEAHRILKGETTDAFDRMLYAKTQQFVTECEEAGHVSMDD